MKRIDDGKVSLVEVMKAVRFARAQRDERTAARIAPFAAFKQRVRAGYPFSRDDAHLIRSAN